MPDLAIAALPALVTPVSTDDIAVEQSGVTKRITINQIINDATLPASFTKLALPLGGTAAAPLLLFGDDSGIWEETDDELSFGVAGVERFTLDVAAGFHALNANGPAILNELGSITNPVLIPDRSDLTTGFGRGAITTLNAVVAGLEVMSWTATQIILEGDNGIDLVFDDCNAFQADNTSIFILSGGSGASVGADLVLHGGAQASPSTIQLRTDGTVRLGFNLGDLRWTVTDALEVQGNVGFYNTTPVAQPVGYTTFTNLSTLRTGDADTLTVAQLADILGTFIEDVKLNGLIGA